MTALPFRTLFGSYVVSPRADTFLDCIALLTAVLPGFSPYNTWVLKYGWMVSQLTFLLPLNATMISINLHLDDSLGCVFVGVLLSLMLYGCTCAQTIYYAWHYAVDKPILKYLVRYPPTVLFPMSISTRSLPPGRYCLHLAYVTAFTRRILDTARMGTEVQELWFYFVQNHGNPFALAQLDRQVYLKHHLACLNFGASFYSSMSRRVYGAEQIFAVVTKLLVQCYFIFKIWQLFRRRRSRVFVVVVALGLSLCSLVFGIQTIYTAYIAKQVAGAVSTETLPGTTQQILSFITELYITISLSYILGDHITGHRRTTIVLSKLIAYIINRAILLSLLTLLALSTYLGTDVHNDTLISEIFTAPSSAVYTNTLLAALNLRKHLGELEREGKMAERPLPTLPVEVWEQVIDSIQEPEYLLPCTLVCRAWYPRSRYHLLQKICVSDKKQVVRVAKLVRSRPEMKGAVKLIVINGGSGDSPRATSIPLLGTFAMMLAGKFTRLDQLEIVRARWVPSTFHPDIFLHLTAFASISHLKLDNVFLPSALIFGRLICAFPNLRRLECGIMSFKNKIFERSLIRVSSPVSELILMGGFITELANFFASTELAANMKQLVLGRWWNAVNLAKLHKLGAQPLLRIAAGSLMDFEITVDGVPGVESAQMKDLLDSHLNLQHNTNLEILCLNVWIQTSMDLSWLHLFLSMVSSKKLREMNIVVHWWRPVPIDEIVLSGLDETQCTLVDTLLTDRRQFPKLTSIDFRFLAISEQDEATRVIMPSQRSWMDQFLPRFPALCARGILKTSVDIRVDYA
ncbi:uncharacterized protein FIBRA_01388 [Fibroporia radiculosa]|uniref:DUF6534 domain-containing protein n=1 Tax=Fibroporia radiculosa TaxID=599839 RepID=J4GK15_9APHY|nr:uncharacterized protein FIBRA_01388 [Fibroporia radiculosa]CCL99370.1 predicted protein [Fibroporia radiculosa]